MTTFAERLKEALALKGITKTELANKTGLDKSLFSNYVSGKYKAKSDNLYRIALALNVSEAWLLGYDVPMERKESSSTDDTQNEFDTLFRLLTDEQKAIVIAQIKGILSNQ